MATKPFGIFEHAYPGDFTSVTNLATLVNATPKYVLLFKQFVGSTSAFVASDYSTVLAYGAIPILTWSPKDPSGNTLILNTDVTAGTYDALINSFAHGIKALSGTVYVRFAHEANGNWYPYSPGLNGNTPATYIAMWQHVVGRFVLAGCTNVRWVFCLNVEPGTLGTYTYAQLYPGDASIDFVALDGYNFGDNPGYAWRTYATAFAQSLADLVAITNKPLCIAEIGCVEGNGAIGHSKATWILDALHQIWKDNRIQFFIWFDYYDALPAFDYRVSSSMESQLAFQSALVTATSFGTMNV